MMCHVTTVFGYPIDLQVDMGWLAVGIFLGMLVVIAIERSRR